MEDLIFEDVFFTIYEVIFEFDNINSTFICFLVTKPKTRYCQLYPKKIQHNERKIPHEVLDTAAIASNTTRTSPSILITSSLNSSIF